ncbi:hypothetical protein EHQ58_02840 [Leptospira ognonensis]|uniref:Uncharacterized protein n=1 Tax=Leptospira ognonensis TaxID=2484945 RepID=A0A4R9K784_9LEPT|nr:hypothetical protein [Leptospira ognonensis]TGL62158.1 hypothetical protein EHQ58_02840 [Leptospira ognonensis]
MFEEEATTWKEKLTRAVVGLFLFILVSMLVVTFLPGDAEQSFIGALTGSSSTKAGSIAGRSVPMDYFNAARRDCYYRYQQYSKEMAGNNELIQSCAFSTTKELFIANDIASAVGFRVSETSIKRDLSLQARQIHKETASQAGYGEEDTRTVDQIYQQILRSTPMAYRLDSATGYSLFQGFLDQKMTPSPAESEIEAEAKSAKVSFRLVAFTEVNLLNQLESKIQISDADLLSEYEKEKKEGNLNKDGNGKIPTFEERKQVLTSKLKFDRKRKDLEVWKKKIQSLVLADNALEAISKETSQSIESIAATPLSNLKLLQSPKGTSFRLASDPKFWEELSANPFGKKKVLGPFTDNDKQIYVEFGDLSFSPSGPAPKKAENTAEEMMKQNKLLGFFIEINKSLSGEYNIDKQKALSLE